MLAASMPAAAATSAVGRTKPEMSEPKAQDRLDVPPLQLSGDKKSIDALTIIGGLGHLPGNL